MEFLDLILGFGLNLWLFEFVLPILAFLEFGVYFGLCCLIVLGWG